MRKTGLLFTIVLLVGQISAQHNEFAARIIKSLTDESFYGRGYVNDGSALAAKFIEEEMKSMGLEIVNQPAFNVPVNVFPNKMQLAINGKHLGPGKDFLIDPSSARASLKSSNIRIISKKQLINEQAFVDLIPPLNNAVAAIDLRGVEEESISKQLNFLRYSQVPSHRALLIFSDNKLTWGLSRVQLSRPVFTVKKTLSIDAIESVSMKVDAKFHPDYPVKNVIGKIKGKNSDSTIVFTAHYDHLGMMGSKTVFPGANDNASGIAMMLNLARYFSAIPVKYDLLFVAFGAEELGLLGSQFFVKNPPMDLSKIKFLVNFDLAGTGGEGITVVNATKYPDPFHRLLSLNDSLQLLPDIKKRGEACNSDHCPFDRKKIPCFYIYTRGGIQAYHDIYDRYETLPLTEFEDYAMLMIEFVKSF